MSIFAQSLVQTIFGHQGISRHLERSRLVQHVAHRFRLRQWLNGALALRPIRRFHRESGVRYNIENFETLSVEKSYFDNPVYREIFSDDPPQTFLDLGCNSGVFPCLLAHLAGGNAPRGICLDANSAQIFLAKKTVELNGWTNIHVVHGLVGAEHPEKEKAEFFLHPTSLGSSQFSYSESESGVRPDWNKTEVPVVKASSLWDDFFPETMCDCLKIDIEGSEMNFFLQEATFLKKVEAVLVEWHAWATSKTEVIRFLTLHSFFLVETIEDTAGHGILYFTKRARS